MYQILLPVDSNEKRAKQAAESVLSLPGDPADLDVLILNVFSEFNVTDVGGNVRSEDLYEDSDVPESVSIAKEILEKEGASVATRREHGDPAETILAIADEIDADTIALSGRKRSPAGKVLFGSVTQAVLLSANRPVYVVVKE